MKKALILKFLLAFIFTISVLYAANTIRITIPETSNDTTLGAPKSYEDQELYILPDSMNFINFENDDSFVGDYFSGFYRDTMYGPFEMQYNAFDGSSGTGVYVTSIDATADCDDSSTHTGYRLDGYSYSPEFGAMDFNSEEVGEYVYLCVPKLENSDTLSYLGGSAYSYLIGLQYFGGIEFDAYVDRDSEHSSDARYVKVDGVISSQNQDTDNEEFENDIRVVGNIEKSSLRKNILTSVYSIIKNATSDNNSIQTVYSSGNQTWNNSPGGGTLLLNGTVLYFGNLGADKTIRLTGTEDITGVKTLVVEGGNILIEGNITDNSGNADMLGLIAIHSGTGGNIIIDSSVTDIHAALYADRSILSSVNDVISDGNTPNQSLANQLYIKGTIFSENTTGGGLNTPYTCPFFVQSTCTQELARKYDLSYLRRYILVTEADDGDPLTVEAVVPDNNGNESMMGDGDDTNTATQAGKSGYRSYPLVIEYDSKIQTTPPPFFGN